MSESPFRGVIRNGDFCYLLFVYYIICLFYFAIRKNYCDLTKFTKKCSCSGRKGPPKNFFGSSFPPQVLGTWYFPEYVEHYLDLKFHDELVLYFVEIELCRWLYIHNTPYIVALLYSYYAEYGAWKKNSALPLTIGFFIIGQSQQIVDTCFIEFASLISEVLGISRALSYLE